MTRKTLALAGVVVAAVAGTAGAVIMANARQAPAVGRETAPNTATVERAELSSVVYEAGTLTYRAQTDGSPYAVINQAGGTYTQLPSAGDRIVCGDALYRVNDQPVLLLYGSTPAYRSLSVGDSGPDVGELNADLVHLRYATRAQLESSPYYFGPETASALRKLQSKLGEDETGSLELGQAVFLPGPVRIAVVDGELAGSAQRGSRVLSATSDTLEVQVALDPSQQGEVKRGDRARITLPDNSTITGWVDRLGRVAQVSSGQSSGAGYATIPAYISLDDPGRAGGLDEAPVQVQITTASARSGLSVPVTALVGKPGGGFAVEVVGVGGRRELVAVTPGLFDDADGLVQVQGDLRIGQRVAVGSS